MHSKSTDLKRDDEQGKSSAERILDVIQVACYEVDKTGVIVYANKKAERFFKRNKNEVLGKRIFDVFPDSCDLPSYAVVSAALVEGKSATVEYYCSITNTWVSLTANPHEGGAVLMFTETAEIKETKSLLQSVFDTSLIGVSVLRPVRNEMDEIIDFRMEMVNKELEKETGRTDLEGKLYAEEFPGIKKMRLFDTMLKVINTGDAEQLEYFFPHDGFKKWFSSMFVKMDDGLVATNLDISDRKHAEEEKYRNFKLLEESEHLAKLGSWQYEFATGIFSWSDGMYRLFDLENGSQVSPDIYVKYATNRSQPVAKRLVDVIMSGDADFEDTVEITVNGLKKVLKIKTTVVADSEGKRERMLGVDIDITKQLKLLEKNQRLSRERRELEARQQQEIFRAILSTQEEERKRIAETLHNSLGQLLYGVKLSLNQVRSIGENSRQKQMTALQQTEVLLADAIRETRRLSHELMPTILEDFGLETAIKDICQQFGRDVKFHCELIGLPKKMDEYMEVAIYRMVQEMMTNIVKHADATEATVRVEVDHPNIEILVKDNGKGFDVTKEEDATGIGFNIIRNKVKLLNGNITISSAQGKGTLIYITISTEPWSPGNQVS